jgi:peptidoglycan-associated lipoprotein
VSASRMSSSCFMLLGTAALLGACAKRPEVVAEAPAPPPPVAAPQPAPEPKPSPPEPVNIDSLISHVVLHFDFDEAVLKVDDQRQLDKLAEVLRTSRTVRIRIEGNCDERGTEEYNLALGHRRAEVAKKYLTDLGIDQPRIDTISYGFEKPVDPRHNEDAWAANRRDEFASISDR